ncbi:hypothetical protein ACFFGH_16430 [Lysobacter korlensis]|uniref:Uncharacterized protein n=1 Tax=Lysobacter korlensis TaxID=553636 RepID=A0ABV6RR19_9GAMM
MDSMTMLQTASALFALAALGGLAMAASRFFGHKHNPPSWLAMAHGLLAAAGLTLLIYAAFTVGVPWSAALAAVLFVVAAVLGVVLNLVYHLRDRLIPGGLTTLHAVLAVSAFVLLLWASFA